MSQHLFLYYIKEQGNLKLKQSVHSSCHIRCTDCFIQLYRAFIVALILGIIALIGVISRFALSTTSLIKEIDTAHHVDQLPQNVSIVLMIQENIDRELQDRLTALEEAVLFMENQIQEVKVSAILFTVRLVCVTSLESNL